MQLKIKGFVSIESLIRNAQNTVAPIGEISTYSLTYAEDKGIYAGGTDNALRLYSFTSQYDDGTVIEVPPTIQDQIFEITQWLLDTTSHDATVNTSNILVSELESRFEGSIASVACGALVEYAPGLRFPERLSWTNLAIADGMVGDDNQITVWFSDSAFSEQYDGYRLLVLPPIDHVDDFFQSKATVEALLNARTLSLSLAKVQEIKNNRPETILTSENYTYVGANAVRLNTTWMVMIYGKRGYDADVIRNAIRSYIAANSIRDESEWRTLFPDIYKNSEFYLYPRWHTLAIPERLLYSGTYSPIVSLSKELDYMKLRHPELPSSHVTTYTQAFSCNYKSIAVITVGSVDNRLGEYSLSHVYPDLINVPFTDTLFDSMAIATRTWIEEIESMIIVAETATSYTNIPRRMKKLTRNGILYISQHLGDHDYLVACKLSTPQYL